MDNNLGRVKGFPKGMGTWNIHSEFPLEAKRKLKIEMQGYEPFR